MSGPLISLSIVSHGQGALVSALLDDLGGSAWHGGRSFEVIVTLNLPEDESWLNGPFRFPLKIVRNERAKGFGANHNAAFSVANGAMFAVVNPDIRLADFRIEPLLVEASRARVGVCGPLVHSPSGGVEDNARRYPTIPRLIGRQLRSGSGPDYRADGSVQSVEWLAGMFMLFPAAIYAAIGGFDERYFMYLEDVEICRLLRRRGYDVRWVGTTAVVHDAARASRRSRQHMSWHLQSLVRFLLGRRRA
jgi:GT2 family glycosyltransferase